MVDARGRANQAGRDEWWISYPQWLLGPTTGAKPGNSSVRYEIAPYRNDDALPCAAGHFIPIYVERGSNRSVPIPAGVRNALATIRSAVPEN